ncbi:MAG: DUF4159 domain-containing protein [Planctomycetales bacterium]|nr:DUF4159 domain-containing protein [Planctomycetales bacterium]
MNNDKLRNSVPVIATLILILGVGSFTFAQRGRRWRGHYDGDRNGVPRWDLNDDFPGDNFRFVRVQYDSHGYGRGGGWRTDHPDSDLNFSLRLQQLTSISVHPDPLVLELTDPRLFDYPFLYMIEPGRLYFYDDEVVALRRYLLNGGFLMVDDFWGDEEYENFHQQIKKVFPDREPQEVPLTHEIFNCVYKLKEKPQVPAINVVWQGDPSITWEERWGSDTSIPYYKAISDDDGRIMVFICHNTDLGDGWEREGMQEWYFREFSMKKAYPMGINIVTYAMTH